MFFLLLLLLSTFLGLTLTSEEDENCSLDDKQSVFMTNSAQWLQVQFEYFNSMRECVSLLLAAAADHMGWVYGVLL